MVLRRTSKESKTIFSSPTEENTKRVFGDLLWPFIIFAGISISTAIMSKFSLKISFLIMIVVLLIALIKKTNFIFYMLIMSLPFTSEVFSIDFGFYFRLPYIFMILLASSFTYNKIISKDYSFIATPIDKPLFLFLMVAAISIFQTFYLSNTPFILFDLFRNYPWIRGFLGLILLFSMIIVYYLTVNIVKDKKMFIKSLKLIMIVCLIISLYGILGFIITFITSYELPQSINPVLNMNGLRAKSLFNEPLFLGNFILSVLPIICSLLITKNEYFKKYLIVLSSIILTIALILTYSRGAWLGYLASLLFLGAVYSRKIYDNLHVIFKISFILLFGLVIILLMDPMVLNMSLAKNMNSAVTSISDSIVGAVNPSTSKFWSTRVRLWSSQHALDALKEHPILGVGYSNYVFYSGYRMYLGLFEHPVYFPETNNYLLKVLSETGLLGFAALIWLFIKIIQSIALKIRSEKEGTKRALMIGFTGSFIAVCTQLLFFSYITYAYLWVILAMMMSLCNTNTIKLKLR